jgi:pyruvate/2-oxoglutarate dehydrogenase complex dihydrolipoamide dehydrogenase (E3) component
MGHFNRKIICRSGQSERRKVQTIRGAAFFTRDKSLHIDGAAWTFDQAVIAIGSAPMRLPGWPESKRVVGILVTYRTDLKQSLGVARIRATAHG